MTREIAHVSAVEIFSSVPDQTAQFFENLMAMEVVDRRGDSVYLRNWSSGTAATPAKVNLVELGFPDMIAALDRGHRPARRPRDRLPGVRSQPFPWLKSRTECGASAESQGAQQK